MKINKKLISKLLMITGAMGIVIVPTALSLTSCSSSSDTEAKITLKYDSTFEYLDVNNQSKVGAYVINPDDKDAIQHSKYLEINLSGVNAGNNTYLSLPLWLYDSTNVFEMQLEVFGITNIIFDDGSSQTQTSYPKNMRSFHIHCPSLEQFTIGLNTHQYNNLKELYFDYDNDHKPQLEKLDVTLPVLYRLDITWYHKLTTLNINAPELNILDADGSNLENFDLSHMPKIESLQIGAVGNLDFSNNPELGSLDLTLNGVSTLNFDTCLKLETLDISSDYLINMNKITNPKLKSLDIYNDNTTQLDLSSCPLLSDVSILSDNFTTLNVSSNVNLTRLTVDSYKFTELNVANNPKLAHLNLMGCNLTELNIRNNPELEYLDLSGNELDTLDCSYNHKLSSIDLGVSTTLTQIDIQGCSSLSKLDFNSNPNHIVKVLYDDHTLLEPSSIDFNNVNFYKAIK